jgi:hypothetical protein
MQMSSKGIGFKQFLGKGPDPCRRRALVLHAWEDTSPQTKSSPSSAFAHCQGFNAHMRGFQPLLNGRLLELLGASTQLAICSKSPCSIAISS